VAYEESIRIPLLARFPAGIERPGRAVEQMVHHLDVCPTLLETAGIPVTRNIQGRSLAPLLQNRAVQWRASWLYEYFYDSPWPTPPNLAVRTTDWKYITYAKDKHGDELFYLADDPRETTNLASSPKHKDQLDRMKKELELLKRRTDYPSS